MKPDSLGRLRQHSRWLSRLTFVLLACTFAVVVGPGIHALVLRAREGATLVPVVVNALVRWPPSFFYLFALWSLARAFRAFAAGGVFGSTMARGCTVSGIGLALGAFFSAVGVPNLMKLLSRTGYMADPRMTGTVLIFDTAYLAVGVVGLALILFGRLMHQAAQAQSEAAALRSELEEFF